MSILETFEGLAAAKVELRLLHGGVPSRPFRAELARRPNIVCKISGVITEADHESWTADQVEPYVAHVIEASAWGESGPRNHSMKRRKVAMPQTCSTWPGSRRLCVM